MLYQRKESKELYKKTWWFLRYGLTRGCKIFLYDLNHILKKYIGIQITY